MHPTARDNSVFHLQILIGKPFKRIISGNMNSKVLTYFIHYTQYCTLICIAEVYCESIPWSMCPIGMTSVSHPTFEKFRPAIMQTQSRKEEVSWNEKVQLQKVSKMRAIKISFWGQIWPALTISGPTSDENGVCHIHSIMRLYVRIGRGEKSAEHFPVLCVNRFGLSLC